MSLEAHRLVKKKTSEIETARKRAYQFTSGSIVSKVEIEQSKAISIVSKIATQQKRFWEIANKTVITIEEVEEMLSEMKYPPISFDIHFDRIKLLHEWLKAVDTHEEREEILNTFVVALYNDDLIDRMLSNWLKYDWLQHRISILNEILKAYRQELYHLSIPPVFSQIEGILAETCPDLREKNGKFSIAKQKEAFERVLYTSPDNLDKSWDKFYREDVLTGFKHGDPIEVLSRNAVVHGGDYEYGTPVNATKSIMTIDYILLKIDEYHRINKEEQTHF